MVVDVAAMSLLLVLLWEDVRNWKQPAVWPKICSTAELAVVAVVVANTTSVVL
jgi:hypothetical protein